MISAIVDKIRKLLGLNLKMIKIIIHLEKPICDCKKNNVGWGFGNGINISVHCNTCGARVVTGSNQRAFIQFKTPYPEGMADKDNVINLVTDDDK